MDDDRMREIAGKVIEKMRSTPFLLALLIINVIALVSFSFAVNQLSEAASRRDAMLEKCISK